MPQCESEWDVPICKRYFWYLVRGGQLLNEPEGLRDGESSGAAGYESIVGPVEVGGKGMGAFQEGVGGEMAMVGVVTGEAKN